MKHKSPIILSFLIFSLILSACGNMNALNANIIRASGTISADEVNISAEISGKVHTVSFEEGQLVRKGDILFTLDPQLIQAQYDQAAAALETAKTAAQTAEVQYELILQNAQNLDQKSRLNAWRLQEPTKFDLPIWYFQKSEKISAAEQEVFDLLEKFNQAAKDNQNILTGEKNQKLIDLDKKIASAQITYQSAQDALNLAKAAKDNEELKDAAQDVFDDAEKTLDDLQDQYDQLLTSKESDDVLAAKAKIQAARATFDSAVARRNQLMSGEDSLQVQAALAVVAQAKAQQAQAAAALNVLTVQRSKCEVASPLDGTLITRNLQAGESITPAGTVMTIADLSEVKLVVYIPEEQFGQVTVGQQVRMTTDSLPGISFTGNVSHIADQAEFTPRNVQTLEGRRSTVYAIDIKIANPDLKLKPGMPVDVEFVTMNTGK